MKDENPPERNYNEIGSDDMTIQWYVLRSKPNKESLLWEQLGINNIEVFYPRLKVNPVNPRARKVKPYFPGYLFIHADLEQIAPSTLQWMPGAIGFVSFDSAPSVVPDSLIHAIQKRVDHVNAAGGEIFEGLKKGDVVTIESGPFAGYEAIFDTRISGTERVRVLLKLLQGKSTKMEVHAGLLVRNKKRK
jgi:transcriptional antiterminator RfaH